ncbi:hypothetical protein UlMin_035527 [Ulmus minor]
MANGNHIPHDIENPPPTIETWLRSDLEKLPPLSSVCCIYRVSERLRLGNDKAYKPQVVSIGPIHHGKEELKPMEEHKVRYLRDFVQRTNQSLGYYIKMIWKNEEKLRSCYAEPIGFEKDEFVKIVLVDAAFIIEVLLRYSFQVQEDKHDRIFNKPWMLQDIWHDLRLLENQLPFFILKELLDTVSAGDGKKFSIIDLSYKFFKELMNFEATEDDARKISSSNVAHFVDFLRSLYVPSSRSGGEIQTLTIPSMTELHRAGVRFKVRSSKNLFDLQFSNGVLEIPKLTISDETELTIRNLLAFEQCHCTENYLNDYVVMLNRLVNSPKDVDLLVKYGIVENRLGDNAEGSTLINKLADGVTIEYNNFYFAKMSEELNVYCRTSWHKWKANLKQNYFNTPWAIVSVIAAIFLIILTIIQAACSVISVIQKT